MCQCVNPEFSDVVIDAASDVFHAAISEKTPPEIVKFLSEIH